MRSYVVPLLLSRRFVSTASKQAFLCRCRHNGHFALDTTHIRTIESFRIGVLCWKVSHECNVCQLCTISWKNIRICSTPLHSIANFHIKDEQKAPDTVNVEMRNKWRVCYLWLLLRGPPSTFKRIWSMNSKPPRNGLFIYFQANWHSQPQKTATTTFEYCQLQTLKHFTLRYIKHVCTFATLLVLGCAKRFSI